MKSIEIKTKHIDELKELTSKLPSEMTQDDLSSLRKQLEDSLFYDINKQNDEDYDTIFTSLKRLLDYNNFRPMDNRSFPEFALDVLLNLIDIQEETVISTDIIYSVTEGYEVDGTMIYNTMASLDYIRTFWDDFIEEDMEVFDAKDVFANPEMFLVHQICNMVYRVTDAILADAGVSEMDQDEFVRYIEEEEIRGYRLSDLVYG